MPTRMYSRHPKGGSGQASLATAVRMEAPPTKRTRAHSGRSAMSWWVRHSQSNPTAMGMATNVGSTQVRRTLRGKGLCFGFPGNSATCATLAHRLPPPPSLVGTTDEIGPPGRSGTSKALTRVNKVRCRERTGQARRRRSSGLRAGPSGPTVGRWRPGQGFPWPPDRRRVRAGPSRRSRDRSRVTGPPPGRGACNGPRPGASPGRP